MDILKEIACLSEDDIVEVVEAVLKRYSELFPDWEISTFSLCRAEDRDSQINLTIQMLENMKTSR